MKNEEAYFNPMGYSTFLVFLFLYKQILHDGRFTDNKKKMDIHVHLNTDNPAFVEQATSDNFQLVSINTDVPWWLSIDKQFAFASAQH